jgi:hypothetical protein
VLKTSTGIKAPDSQSWYDKDTYYQILLVTKSQMGKTFPNINTSVIAKTRGDLGTYRIDETTKNKLGDYPPEYKSVAVPEHTVGSYLPSRGVVLSQGFVNTILQPGQSAQSQEVELNNFYTLYRSQLINRKISQLIAKTWHTYLDARKTGTWDTFVDGRWSEIDNNTLDGLIAREIFLFDKKYSPDYFDPDLADNIYSPKSDKKRFLIVSSSLAWQGITLGLLLAGQAYYRLDVNGKYTNDDTKAIYYHQISQPFLSTGDIVDKYALEVDWNRFEGNTEELEIGLGKSSVAYRAYIPYPPIPSEQNSSSDEIKEWADADDEDGKFPFYNKQENGTFSVDVKYSSPPYPYIPLSCS